MLAHTGVCGSFGWPANASLVGLAGGAEYGLLGLPAGLFVKVRVDAGTAWHLFIQQSGAVDWLIVDQALAWNAGLQQWECTIVRHRISPPACTQTLFVAWRPLMISGMTWRRGPIDELTNGGTKVLSWYHENAELPLHTRRGGSGGQALWTAGHTRGVTRKYGSVALPKDTGPTTWWAP